MNIKRTIYILFFAFFLFSCNKKTYNILDLEDMKWIEGKWESKDNDINISEIWKFNNNEFHGISKIIIGKDTIYSEEFKTNINSNKNIVLYYTNDNNKNEPCLYLKKLKNNIFVFRSRESLKTISYKLINKDTIEIKIIENIDNKKESSIYTLLKIY